MWKLKTQIKESFFNPVLQALPVLVFILVIHLFGSKYAWYSAAIITIGLIVYVRIAYKGLFKWYIFYISLFFVIVTIMSIVINIFPNENVTPILPEVVLITTFIILDTLRKPLTTLSDKLVSPFIPMGNNISELYKNIKTSIFLVATYLLGYFLVIFFDRFNTLHSFSILTYIYLTLIIFLILFSLIKTKFVRSQLAGERWLPIINKEGKVIGIIQRMSSFCDRRKYIHPVVRGIVVNEGRILMQLPANQDDIFYKPLWDNLISNHIDIGDKAEDSLKKTAFEYLGIENIKSFYLTKYDYETPYEYQYVLVFIIGKYDGEIIPNPKKIESLKWWTMPQIDSNLNSGIFDERFIKEYDLLKRAGLLESEEYDCQMEETETIL